MDLWNKALQILDQDDRQHFLVLQKSPRNVLASILKDVQAKRDVAHERRWKFSMSNGSTIILRDVFEKILHAVTSCAKAVDVAVNTAPMYAAPPWAVIRFLLQVSTMDLGAFGCMSEGIEIVTSVIARYEIIERLYLYPTTASMDCNSQLLNNCIIKVYTIILKYLIKAKKFWSENTAKRIVKAPFTNMEAENTRLQTAIKNADDETDRITSLLQDQRRTDESKATREALKLLLEETMSPVFRMARNISDINDKLDRSQRRELLHWLSTVPCESQHEEAARTIVKGTGQWLLDRPELLEWQRSSTSALFWLHGIPGAGKSKLTSIVIESFIKQHKMTSGPPPPLAYFYCSKRGTDARSKDPLEILCALLRQLTGRNTQLPLRGSVAAEFARRKEISDGTGAQVPRLNMEEVVTHILNIAIDDPIIIVVDGLDEADDAGRGDLFKSFEKVLQESQNVVKIFVSSRTDGDIVDTFEHHSNIGIEEEMNAGDIKKFADYKIQEAIETKRLLRGRVSTSLRDEIGRTLVSKAQGMFRWVELSIETLSNSRRMALEKDVRSELGKLPAKLKEQYRIIYDDILDSAHATSSIACRTFSWILAAQRTLTVEEMIAAVALDDDGFYHKDLDVPLLLGICRNLLIVTSISHASEQETFQMAHLSVREFLEELQEFSAQQIHTIATSRLLDNFSPSLWRENNVSIGEPIEILRDYTIYLFEHAEMSSLTKLECDLAHKMRWFLFDHQYKPTAKLNEWHHLIEEFMERYILPKHLLDIPFYHRRKCDSLDGEGLYLICMHGLLSVLQSLGDDERIPWRASASKHLATNLYAATKHGKFDVVKWLLEKRLFHPDETTNHVPALYSAIWEKKEELVSLLLEHGANPLSRFEVGFHHTAWDRVFAIGLEHRQGYSFNIFKQMFDSIEILQRENHHIFSSLGFDWKLEGLFEALRANWEEASHFLIQRGANDWSHITQRTDYLLVESERQSSTLQIAACYSGYQIVKALLDRSLECSTHFDEQSSASGRPQSSRHRAYINHLDPNGRSVLHYLMLRESLLAEESEGIMRLLLEHGVDTTIVSDKGLTTLHVAASIGSIDLVRELSLREGLQVEPQDIHGATTLHIASGGAHRKPDIIRYLTDHGQDPLGRDSNGDTPLHYAASVCNFPALEFLLKVVSGVDDLSRSGSQWSTTAKVFGREICQISPAYGKLVKHVNIINNEGESLLHVIGKKRYFVAKDDEDEQTQLEIRHTVRLLIDLGANLNMKANSKTPLISLLSAGYCGGFHAVKELLDKGADLDIPDSTGAVPLHYSARYWFPEPMKDLLDAGADIEARDHDLCTPLHIASKSGFPQLTELLLLRDADCEARDRIGATPLHYAVNSFSSGIVVSMLIQKGANVQSADTLGATPLHFAAKAGKLSIISLLIRYGANPEAVDKNGKTASHYAAKYASIISEHDKEDARYLTSWLHLLNASKEWCQRNDTKPLTLMKRPQSQMLRTDQSWGDFSEMKSKELARL